MFNVPSITSSLSLSYKNGTKHDIAIKVADHFTHQFKFDEIQLQALNSESEWTNISWSN